MNVTATLTAHPRLAFGLTLALGVMLTAISILTVITIWTLWENAQQAKDWRVVYRHPQSRREQRSGWMDKRTAWDYVRVFEGAVAIEHRRGLRGDVVRRHLRVA